MFKTANPSNVDNVQSVTYFSASIDGLANLFCVYEIWQEKTLIYIGSCKLTALHQIPDAQRNSEFMRMVGREGEFNLRLIASGDRSNCHNFRARHARSFPELPICNRVGTSGRFTAIICNEDGRKYRTQTEAATAYGVSQSAISNHMRGRIGYQTVGGKTFSPCALS